MDTRVKGEIKYITCNWGNKQIFSNIYSSKNSKCVKHTQHVHPVNLIKLKTKRRQEDDGSRARHYLFTAYTFIRLLNISWGCKKLILSKLSFLLSNYNLNAGNLLVFNHRAEATCIVYVYVSVHEEAQTNPGALSSRGFTAGMSYSWTQKVLQLLYVLFASFVK